MPDKSTIVRLIRAGAWLLRWLAPGLAARALERLFLTPTRYPLPPRELEWLGGGVWREVPLGDGRSVPACVWGAEADGPTILLAHGWSGRGSQLGAFVAPLRAAGARVISFDAPGHGRAEGRLSGIPWFALAIQRVAEDLGPIDGIIAHSLGTAASSLALSRGLDVPRVVYVSPPDNPGQYLGRVARHLGFGDRVAARTRGLIEARFGARFEEASPLTLAPRLSAALLAIHDRGDKEVPYAEGARLVSAWPDARLMSTRGLGHRRILRDPEVVKAAAGFLTEARRPVTPSDHPLEAAPAPR